MKNNKQAQQITIRDLMPKNFLSIIRERTGAAYGTISRVVNSENTESTIWPAIIKLAEETQQQKRKEQERLIKLKSVA